jgi:hypothetical protein
MLTYIKYNDEKFAVTGDKDLHHSEINKIGGRWNSRMKGGAGWLVPISQESELKKLIRKVKKEHKLKTEAVEQKNDAELLEKVLEMVDAEVETENKNIDTKEFESENPLELEQNSNINYVESVSVTSNENYTEDMSTENETKSQEEVNEPQLEEKVNETQLEKEVNEPEVHLDEEVQVQEVNETQLEEYVNEPEAEIIDNQLNEEMADVQEEQPDNTDLEQQIIDNVENDITEDHVEMEEQNEEEMQSLCSNEEDSKTLSSILKQEQEVIPSSYEVENKHQELFDNYKSEMTYNSESDDETRSEDSYTRSPGSYSKSENESPSHNSVASIESNSDDDTIINNMKDAKQAIEFVDIDSDDDSAIVENFLNNLLGDLSDEEERTRKLKKSKERFRRITKSRELERKKKQEKIKFKQKVLEADSARKNVSNTAPTFEFYKNLAFRNSSGEAAVSDTSDSDYSDESDDDYPSASTVKKKTKAEEIIDLEAEVAQLRLENEKLSTQIKTFIQKY